MTTSAVGHSQEDLAQRWKSSRGGVLWLLLVGLALFALCAMFAYPRHGGVGVVTAAVSVIVCWVPASVALVVSGMLAGTSNAVSGLLAGMVCRTVVPFMLALLLTQAFRPLAEAGLFGMVLVNFLVLLTVETGLIVRIVHAHSTSVLR